MVSLIVIYIAQDDLWLALLLSDGEIGLGYGYLEEYVVGDCGGGWFVFLQAT